MYIVFYFFIVGAVLGWILEIVFKTLTKNENVSAGILNGPFCILYGIGIMFISVFLSKIQNKFILFISIVFFMSFFEYITDIFLYKIYNIRLWDYSNIKFNIKGRVCIIFSIAWGLLGMIYVKYILKYLYTIYYKIDEINLIISMLIIYILVDFFISSIKLLKNKRQKQKYSV